MVGPYVDSNGAAQTGLTVTQSTLMLSKNGTAFVAKNETTNASHRILGYYSAMLNDTDTGSAGRVLLVSSATGSLPLWQEYMVLPSSVYDSLISSGTPLPVNVTQWNGVAPNALISGRVDTNPGAIQNSVITSAALASTFRPDVNVAFINSLATNVPSATLTLRQLVIQNNSTSVVLTSGSASVIYGTGVNAPGIDIAVTGSGSALRLTAGGSGGNAFQLEGNSFNSTFHVTDQKSGYAVNSLFGNALADFVLRRDMSLLSGIAARSPLNALRVLRNRITTSGGLTIYAEDDTTAVWTAALTSNASAAPIVESDPA